MDDSMSQAQSVSEPPQPMTETTEVLESQPMSTPPVPPAPPTASSNTGAANSNMSQMASSFWGRMYNGRLNRLTYFLTGIIVGIIGDIIYFIVIIGTVYMSTSTNASVNLISVLLFIVLYILLIFAIFSLMIRRLHDIGLVGTWSLLAIVPLVNIIFGFYLLFASGNAGDNKYGPQPVGVDIKQGLALK